MTRDDQLVFVERLMNSVKDEILTAILTGKIPAEWDGHELRELLYEKFQFERTRVMAGPGPRKCRKRVKEYRNTVLINNL